MLKLAPASRHVKRHLTPLERSTIAVALELLARAPDSPELRDVVLSIGSEDALLTDEQMRALAFEVTRARKVKVCRTKQAEA